MAPIQRKALLTLLLNQFYETLNETQYKHDFIHGQQPPDYRIIRN